MEPKQELPLTPGQIKYRRSKENKENKTPRPIRDPNAPLTPGQIKYRRRKENKLNNITRPKRDPNAPLTVWQIQYRKRKENEIKALKFTNPLPKDRWFTHFEIPLEDMESEQFFVLSINTAQIDEVNTDLRINIRLYNRKNRFMPQATCFGVSLAIDEAIWLLDQNYLDPYNYQEFKSANSHQERLIFSSSENDRDEDDTEVIYCVRRSNQDETNFSSSIWANIISQKEIISSIATMRIRSACDGASIDFHRSLADMVFARIILVVIGTDPSKTMNDENAQLVQSRFKGLSRIFGINQKAIHDFKWHYDAVSHNLDDVARFSDQCEKESFGALYSKL